MPTLITGSDQAKAIDDQAAAARAAARGSYLDRQKFENGKEVFLRPVTEHSAWISIATHNYIPTKDKPAAIPESVKWQERMWGVCQNHKTFLNLDSDGSPIPGDYEDGYGACWICANLKGRIEGKYNKDLGKPENVIYGIFAVRVPHFEGDRLTGFSNELTEHKNAEGKTVKVPKLVLCIQKWSNFYGAIKTASFMDGMVTNKDFMIQRNDTDYRVTATPPTADHHPGTDSWKEYTDTLELMKFDLGKYLIDHSTPDHYKRWFIPGAEPEGGYNSRARSGDGDEAGSAPAASGSAPSQPVEPELAPDMLAKFRADLESRGAKA